jgi:hypothetical protein
MGLIERLGRERIVQGESARQASRACYRHYAEGRAVVWDCTEHGRSVPLAPQSPFTRRALSGQLPARDKTAY